eukprot:CAMPEP_0181353486 /NCGR_PEP_ID=MMETSP1106-20121128/2858_1 /TAXON_ID=81844 /ORGANISM="Mantoniella antarctica, Strain SL-175" /LENGTH=42 /DNA_ID= /DNA_START= /DNA_END= /DNA_ORIENTATION=
MTSASPGLPPRIFHLSPIFNTVSYAVVSLADIADPCKVAAAA